MSSPSLRALALLSFAVASAQTQSPDTIRVGSLPLRPLTVRVDTFDVDFQMPTPAGPQRQQGISIVRISSVISGADTAMRVRFESDKPIPYWEVDVDRRTLATLRYAQYTPVDSLVLTKRGDCIGGWVDMPRTPRRIAACDRFTDRFAGSPMDEYLIPLLPLRVGQSYLLATYVPTSGTAGSYGFTVVAEETLTLAQRTFRTWRVEHRTTTNFGPLVAKVWVDQDRPRTLRTTVDFPNGGGTTRTLRHP
jgi:hypothetical protein